MGKRARAIGLMSGTSMDGIEAALLETDGENEVQRIATASRSYAPDFRRRLVEGNAAARDLLDRAARPGPLAALERDLTAEHAAAVQDLIGKAGIDRGNVDVIGFHGQTVRHEPHIGLTIQLGCGPSLAKATGIDVVYDLRAADIASGGQGAPLVPVYHRAMVARLERPVAVVNIGGVANVTWVGPSGELIAFDTGPGNALLDDWMMAGSQRPIDFDGAAALSGSIDDDALLALLTHPYFGAVPPKSLDRNAFSPKPVERLSLEDGAATLAAFTAESIARARAHFPLQPKLWVIVGGGRRNRAIMSELAGRVENAVVPAEAIGLDGASIEAEAWAYLAVRSLRGLPITYPTTTGASFPMTGGRLAKSAP